MTPPDCTEEIEGNDELRDWAESLRDQVSRISGRKIPGFSAELKGDLLDAIDILVEQASGEAATNPLDSALEKIQGQIGEATERQAQELQATTESFMAKLSTDLVEGRFESKLSELTDRWQHTEEVLQRLDEENVDKEDQLTAIADQFCEVQAKQSAWQQTQTEEFFELKALVQRLSDESQSRAADSSDASSEQLELLQKREAELEATLADAKAQKSQLESEKQELANRLVSMQQHCNDLQQHILDGSTSLREFAGENRELSAQLEAWKRKRTEAVEQLEELRTQRVELQAKLDQAEIDLRDKTEALDELEEQQIELFARVERLQEENQNLVEEQAKQEADDSLSIAKTTLETQLQQLEQKLETLEQENQGLSEQLSQAEQDSTDRTRTQALESEEREELESQLEQLKKQVDELESEKASLQEAAESDNSNVEATDAIAQENQQLHQRLVELESQLESAGSQRSDDESERVRELKELLTAAKDEIESLQATNEKLNFQIDEKEDDANEPVNPEDMSWEDRKRLIMQQFEDAEDDSSDKKMEVDDIIASTEQALETKDRVIQELQQRLQSKQSDSPNPVDLDEAVQQEREKLQKMQAEWQDKIRQAEIDLSAERARLARERTQIEGKQSQAKPEAESKTGGRTRKWLDHLGLREQKKQ